jgi:hypothetical protein
MASKIFVNYRRDDDPNGAARVRDGLAAKFGEGNVFMDVDNLLAGQRFDEELAKALSQCDVLVAVIGPRWMDLLKARAATGERDFVREEIAAALAQEVKLGSTSDTPARPVKTIVRDRLMVVPVRVGREGQMPALPRREELPEDIRDLVLYQKHDVAHERFGRDIAELIEAIQTVRQTNRPQYAAPRVRWAWVGATATIVALAGWISAYQIGRPIGQPRAGVESSSDKRLKLVTDPAILARLEYDIDFSESEDTIKAAIARLRPEQQAAARKLWQAAQASTPAHLLKKGAIVPDNLPANIRACLNLQGQKKPWEYDWARCNVIVEE